MQKLKPATLNLKSSRKFKRLLGGRVKTRNLRCGLVTLKPGESVGEHSTDNKEEVLIILQGRARVSYAKHKFFKLKEHSLVYFSPRTAHNVENIGTEKLKYLYLTSAVT